MKSKMLSLDMHFLVLNTSYSGEIMYKRNYGLVYSFLSTLSGTSLVWKRSFHFVFAVSLWTVACNEAAPKYKDVTWCFSFLEISIDSIQAIPMLLYLDK